MFTVGKLEVPEKEIENRTRESHRASSEKKSHS